MKPPYFKQQSNYTCSLAILRSVLSANNINVSEVEMVKKVIPSYGKNFTNIWNPTIAKLAREYKIPTQIYAKWSLFKKNVMKKAIRIYNKNPKKFNYKIYENSRDDGQIPEPLLLAYKDMFTAYEKGCSVKYGGLTERRIKKFIDKNKLIQTSIKLHALYPKEKRAFHSILIYNYKNNKIIFHDPTYGKSLSASFKRILKATTNVGAFIIYGKK